MFDFDELSGEEAEETRNTDKPKELSRTSPSPDKVTAAPTASSRAAVQEDREMTLVSVRHAIHEWEIHISIPRDALFADLKRALAMRFLEDANASFPGQLVRKEGGVYSSYKDSAELGEVRQVLLAGFEPEAAPREGEDFVFKEVSKGQAADLASPDRSLESFIALQQALRSGFGETRFQEQLHELKEQCERGELKKTTFLEKRQKLFLTVQSKVLPKFGYEGTSLGVYKMMGDMKPYVKEPDFVVLADEINALLGIDYSPPDTWTALSDSCQKLNDEKDVARFAPEARRAKQEHRRNEFRPPLGLLGPVGVPSLISGKPLRLPDSILQGVP